MGVFHEIAIIKIFPIDSNNWKIYGNFIYHILSLESINCIILPYTNSNALQYAFYFLKLNHNFYNPN
jgi:hypothetical protein